MNIGIRVDASIEIGTGHVMRCLTLADKLRDKGATVYFITRLHKGHLADVIEKKGYTVYKLSKPDPNVPLEKQNSHSSWLGAHWTTDARETLAILKEKGSTDLLIIDHYAIQKEWEYRLRPHVGKIMVIDDLADRPHDCDYLLNQNYAQNMFSRYNQLIPPNCHVFLGPRYALLRNEFLEEGKQLRERNGKIKRILIFFGGSDYKNITEKALKAMLELNRNDIIIDVVVGKHYAYHFKLKKLCQNYDFVNYHVQVNNMAQLMREADVCIGAGGTATWERCYMGLPTILITVAKNQELIAQDLSNDNIVVYLGANEEVTGFHIVKAFVHLLENPQKLRDLSQRSTEIVGTNSGFLDEITEMLLRK